MKRTRPDIHVHRCHLYECDTGHRGNGVEVDRLAAEREDAVGRTRVADMQ
jgi:hypothetical protein